MTFFATPRTSMRFFVLAVAAMAWSIMFLFFALKFLFTTPIIIGLAIGLLVLLYAMTALVGGTMQRVTWTLPRSGDPKRDSASRVLMGSTTVGSIAIFLGILGQWSGTWFGVAFSSGLWDLWLGLMAFGLVIQLYGQAAYLRNLA
jgi:hypothetical protein